MVHVLKNDIAGATAHAKSGKSRKVPLTAELRTALLARCHASGYVFGLDEKDGEPPTAAAVSVAMTRLARALSLDGISHHTLRHTGATTMSTGGVSLRAIMQIGGWTSLRMVERYAHVDDAELARAVRLTHNHTDAALKVRTKTRTEASGGHGKSRVKTGAK